MCKKWGRKKRKEKERQRVPIFSHAVLEVHISEIQRAIQGFQVERSNQQKDRKRAWASDYRSRLETVI